MRYGLICDIAGRGLAVLICAITSFAAFSATADDNELLLGGVTVHLSNPSGLGKAYKGKLTPYGEAIANPLIGLRRVNYHRKAYYSYGGFAGLNSVGCPITGGLLSLGFNYGPARFGAVHGLYIQDNNKFRERGIEPLSIQENRGTGYVPIIGWEYVHLLSRDVRINLLLTPILSNVSLGIKF